MIFDVVHSFQRVFELDVWNSAPCHPCMILVFVVVVVVFVVEHVLRVRSQFAFPLLDMVLPGAILPYMLFHNDPIVLASLCL